MKSERRHDLQTNVLADWLGGKVSKIQANASWVGGGFLLILIVVVFLFVRQNRLASVASEGWTRFQQARSSGLVAISQQQPLALNNTVRDLEDIAREYASDPIAAYAHLTLGDLLLQNGRTQYSLNKTAARDAFQAAARYYQMVVESTKSPDIKNRALFCQGKSLEWQLKLSQAKEIYQKVSGPYGPEAEARIRNLDHKGTEAFYKQFAEWKPKPKPEATGEKRYDGVDFKLEDQSLPSASEVEAALQQVGVEDAAEEAAAGGGEAPAKKTDSESENSKPEPESVEGAGEVSPASPSATPKK